MINQTVWRSVQEEVRMALQLSIIKYPPGVALAEDRKVFGPQGGFIGRGVDNDWVLTDPERFLSSKHCQISREGSQYFLTDLSTNGTFLNGTSEPLGRGSRSVLRDGDHFDVGDYRFQVALINETSADIPSPFSMNSPFENSTPFAEPTPFSVDNFAFSSEPVAPESMFMSGNYQGVLQDIAPDSLKITDPLIALDNAAQMQSQPFHAQPSLGAIPDTLSINALTSTSNGLNDPFDDPFNKSFGLGQNPLANTGTMGDSSNFMSESIAWPETKEVGGLLPEDWDDDWDLDNPAQQQTAFSATPVSENKLGFDEPFEPLVKQAEAVKKRDELGISEPVLTPRPGNRSNRPSQIKNAEPYNQTDDRDFSSTAPYQVAPIQSVAHQPPTTPSVHSTTAMDRTLLDALGLGDAHLTDDQIREVHHTVGLMMRETLEGLMQILRARASIKNEFRINITTIQPVENNPIKFSVNVDEVLDIMFLRKTRAYKPPLEAVQESFHSIADHQLAVIAGIRSAFKSALSRFDPVTLEEEFKQTGKGGLLPGVMKGKFWTAYQEHYERMVNDMERSFQELFGEEFVQAYEDQMRKLSNARKHDS